MSGSNNKGWVVGKLVLSSQIKKSQELLAARRARAAEKRRALARSSSSTPKIRQEGKSALALGSGGSEKIGSGASSSNFLSPNAVMSIVGDPETPLDSGVAPSTSEHTPLGVSEAIDVDAEFSDKMSSPSSSIFGVGNDSSNDMDVHTPEEGSKFIREPPKPIPMEAIAALAREAGVSPSEIGLTSSPQQQTDIEVSAEEVSLFFTSLTSMVNNHQSPRVDVDEDREANTGPGSTANAQSAEENPEAIEDSHSELGESGVTEENELQDVPPEFREVARMFQRLSAPPLDPDEERGERLRDYAQALGRTSPWSRIFHSHGRQTPFANYDLAGLRSQSLIQVISTLNPSSGDTVLDVSCGHGSFLGAMHVLFPGVALRGTETEDRLVALARQNLASLNALCRINKVDAQARFSLEGVTLLFCFCPNFINDDLDELIKLMPTCRTLRRACFVHYATAKHNPVTVFIRTIRKCCPEAMMTFRVVQSGTRGTGFRAWTINIEVLNTLESDVNEEGEDEGEEGEENDEGGPVSSDSVAGPSGIVNNEIQIVGTRPSAIPSLADFVLGKAFPSMENCKTAISKKIRGLLDGMAPVKFKTAEQRLNPKKPICYGLQATSPYKKGEVICFYGGMLRLINRAEVAPQRTFEINEVWQIQAGSVNELGLPETHWGSLIHETEDLSLQNVLFERIVYNQLDLCVCAKATRNIEVGEYLLTNNAHR